MSDDALRLYYAPPAAAPLGRWASRWLGRDAGSGEALPQPPVPGIEKATVEPRRYGFHATLKAPFQLAPRRSERDLVDAAAAFADGQSAFHVELRLTQLRGFYALTSDSPLLCQLAEHCVRHFDEFRAPSVSRPTTGLTSRQIELQEAWGYPHVFDEFQFHMTLTGKFGRNEAAAFAPLLETETAPFRADPVEIEGIAIFGEPAPGEPFTVRARFPFGAPALRPGDSAPK